MVLTNSSGRQPAILVIDDEVSVTDMNGYELTERLKGDSRLSGIPVIYLHGKSPAEDAGRAFATGALTYVRKPFTAQQLRDIVTLALQ